MIIGLTVILMITLFLPFASKKIEHNLEFFLFFMGIGSVIVTNVLSKHLILEIFENKLMYMITAAVLIAGVIFKLLKSRIKYLVASVSKVMSVKMFVFLVIIILGLLSSVITAIIASLILVEIVSVLPLDRTKKIEITIVSCFSIGLGASLTPIGEPIATIVVSKLGESFWYIFNQIGILVLVEIILLGLIGMWLVENKKLKSIFKISKRNLIEKEIDDIFGAENFDIDEDDIWGILHRTFKIFIFIIALELLGAGFKPLIDTYVISLDSSILYWGNITSAVLDNATLAAAEISVRMTQTQIKSILLGLLISGGILVPGNIPNIISAGKLKIKSSQWVRLGVPLGLFLLLLNYVLLFIR
ncbi:MAG: DUF1646 family protein [Bacillota bacterium]|nr:DUF1646 family protein [Bacillota bacterium]